MIKLLFVSLGFLVIFGCTKPINGRKQFGITDEQWARDMDKCLSWSLKQSDKNIPNRPISNSFDATGTGFRQFMSNYDIKRSQKKLMESCLRQNGYYPTPSKSE